jgi:hypothetical protein
LDQFGPSIRIAKNDGVDWRGTGARRAWEQKVSRRGAAVGSRWRFEDRPSKIGPVEPSGPSSEDNRLYERTLSSLSSGMASRNRRIGQLMEWLPPAHTLARRSPSAVRSATSLRAETLGKRTPNAPVQPASTRHILSALHTAKRHTCSGQWAKRFVEPG